MPAWLLPLIMGGASLFGAGQSAKAAKDAAKTQAHSAEQALALQQQMFQQTRADLSPYRQYGVNALAAGHQLMGLPAPALEAAPPMVPLSQLVAPLPGSAPSLSQMGTSAMGALVGRGGPNTALTGSPTFRGAAAGGVPQGMVLLRAPNGQAKAVPADQVNYYLARGATRG